jgi:hypothetical protein
MFLLSLFSTRLTLSDVINGHSPGLSKLFERLRSERRSTCIAADDGLKSNFKCVVVGVHAIILLDRRCISAFQWQLQ